MVDIIKFTSAEKFLERVRPSLEKDEPANNQFLGAATALAERSGTGDQIAPFLTTVENSGTIEVAAIMTLPNKVLLFSEMQPAEESLRVLVQIMVADGLPVTGVVAERKLAELFQEQWTKSRPCVSRLAMVMRVFVLTQLAEKPAVNGRLRLAEEREIPLLQEWCDGFIDEVSKGEKNPARYRAQDLIQKQVLHIWEDMGKAVSMADIRRPTRNCSGIGLVYTPPEFRKKGYAQACVWSLCEKVLKSGKRYCSLFADVANQASCGMYERIGFRPRQTIGEYSFDPTSSLA